MLVVLSALVGAAVAANHPFTKGDATALFNGNGGPSVLLHNPSSEVGAFEPGKRIGPGQNFQGFHVCATDWHVMFVQLAMVDSLDNVHTIGEARTAFQRLNVTYELDGAPLAVRVTSVQPVLGDVTLLDPNATVGFRQRTGAILSPDALSVGAHTEQVRLFQDGVLFDDLGLVTFYADEPERELACDLNSEAGGLPQSARLELPLRDPQ